MSYFLPSALCPSALGPLRERITRPDWWHVVPFSKKERRAMGLGWGLLQKASLKCIVGTAGLLLQRTGMDWEQTGQLETNICGPVGEMLLRTSGLKAHPKGRNMCVPWCRKRECLQGCCPEFPEQTPSL